MAGLLRLARTALKSDFRLSANHQPKKELNPMTTKQRLIAAGKSLLLGYLASLFLLSALWIFGYRLQGWYHIVAPGIAIGVRI